MEFNPAPLVIGLSPLAALYYGYQDYVANPEALERPSTTTAPPAAPRSRAEMISGYWTPEDALLYGQREAVVRKLEQDALKQARPSSTAIVSTTDPKDPGDNTFIWILGAVAVTGIAISIFRR